jgi:hypothetical protein
MTFPVNLISNYYFQALLLSRDVNNHKRCDVKNEVDSMTPCLTEL